MSQFCMATRFDMIDHFSQSVFFLAWVWNTEVSKPLEDGPHARTAQLPGPCLWKKFLKKQIGVE